MGKNTTFANELNWGTTLHEPMGFTYVKSWQTYGSFGVKHGKPCLIRQIDLCEDYTKLTRL